jgi:hypothetical protein
MTYAIDIPFKAAVDLSSKQYYLAIAGSVADEVNVQSADAASCIGVLQNDPGAGEEAVVRVFGRTWVYADTSAAASPVTYGGLVKSGSNGMATGFVAGGACKFSLGYALDALASGSGVLIEMFVLGPRKMADA